MSIFYSVRHLTRFRYSSPVSESLMEVRMHPRTEGNQRCLSFKLSVDPRAHVHSYRDYLGNTVDHFDVPGKHSELRVLAESLVELEEPLDLPDRLSADAWNELDHLAANGDFHEMLAPSHYAEPTEALQSLIGPLQVARKDCPIAFLRRLNTSIFKHFDYAPKSTRVDSPIDHAIEVRKGVCQDFAHIMIALVRHVRIPCRYVSGYLSPRSHHPDRSSDGASHAWVEALVPGYGWVGFDPTNNLLAGERHIRTAIGRDYADVPPTRGMYKGDAASQLAVTVRVQPADAPAPELDLTPVPGEWHAIASVADEYEQQRQQQQQQQQ